MPKVSIDLEDDPRDDLQKDSNVWDFVLQELYDKNKFRALSAMYAFRLHGGQLEHDEESDSIVFTAKTIADDKVDNIDDESKLESTFTEEEYDNYIDKILKPVADDIRPVLNEVLQKVKNVKNKKGD